MRQAPLTICTLVALAVLTACTTPPRPDRFAPYGAALRRHRAAVQRIGELGGAIVPEPTWSALAITDADPETTAAILALAPDVWDLGSVSLFASTPPVGWLSRFAGHRHLQHVAVSFARVSVPDIATLRILPALESLELVNATATDAHITALAASAPQLKRLTLAGAHVTDYSVATLARFDRLRHLRLTDSAVTEEGLGRLLADNPWLVIHLGDGGRVIAGAWAGR